MEEKFEDIQKMQFVTLVSAKVVQNVLWNFKNLKLLQYTESSKIQSQRNR